MRRPCRRRPQYTHVVAWLARCEARPASQQGIRINNTWEPTGLPEYHKD